MLRLATDAAALSDSSGIPTSGHYDKLGTDGEGRAEMIYAAPPADALLIVPLDELTAVYHRPAGATHLLAEPAPQLLAALQAGPADADTLFARLSASFDLDADARAGIAAHLDELVAAGLVTTT